MSAPIPERGASQEPQVKPDEIQAAVKDAAHLLDAPPAVIVRAHAARSGTALSNTNRDPAESEDKERHPLEEGGRNEGLSSRRTAMPPAGSGAGGAGEGPPHLPPAPPAGNPEREPEPSLSVNLVGSELQQPGGQPSYEQWEGKIEKALEEARERGINNVVFEGVPGFQAALYIERVIKKGPNRSAVVEDFSEGRIIFRVTQTPALNATPASAQSSVPGAGRENQDLSEDTMPKLENPEDEAEIGAIPFEDLKELLEEAFTNGGNKPVSLVESSMGLLPERHAKKEAGNLPGQIADALVREKVNPGGCSFLVSLLDRESFYLVRNALISRLDEALATGIVSVDFEANWMSWLGGVQAIHRQAEQLEDVKEVLIDYSSQFEELDILERRRYRENIAAELLDMRIAPEDAPKMLGAIKDVSELAQVADTLFKLIKDQPESDYIQRWKDNPFFKTWEAKQTAPQTTVEPSPSRRELPAYLRRQAVERAGRMPQNYEDLAEVILEFTNSVSPKGRFSLAEIFNGRLPEKRDRSAYTNTELAAALAKSIAGEGLTPRMCYRLAGLLNAESRKLLNEQIKTRLAQLIETAKRDRSRRINTDEVKNVQSRWNEFFQEEDHRTEKPAPTRPEPPSGPEPSRRMRVKEPQNYDDYAAIINEVKGSLRRGQRTSLSDIFKGRIPDDPDRPNRNAQLASDIATQITRDQLTPFICSQLRGILNADSIRLLRFNIVDRLKEQADRSRSDPGMRGETEWLDNLTEMWERFSQGEYRDAVSSEKRNLGWIKDYLPGNEIIQKMKKLPGGLWNSLMKKEDLKANLATAGTFALIRAGINWGTGGLGLAASVGVGGVAGGVRAGIGATYKEFAQERQKLAAKIQQDIIDKGSADEADQEKLMRLENTSYWNLKRRYQALPAESRDNVWQGIKRGAFFGALGAGVGFEIKEWGVVDKASNLLGRFWKEDSNRSAIETFGGAITANILNWRRMVSKLKKRDHLSNKEIAFTTIGASFYGAFLGVVAGEAGTEIFDALKPSAIPAPEATKVATPGEARSAATATIQSQATEAPKPALTATPVPTEIPTRTPDAPTPTSTSTPEPTASAPEAPPVSAPPDILKTINEKIQGGQLHLNQEMYTLYNSNLAAPDPFLKYTDINNLIDQTSPDHFQLVEDDVYSPYGTEFSSLKGKIEGWIGEDFFTQPDPAILSEIENRVAQENIQFFDNNILNELKAGTLKFDPYTPDHARLFNLLKESPNGSKLYEKMLLPTYTYAKFNTPDAFFNSQNSDYFMHNTDIAKPTNLKQWFTTIRNAR